MKFYINLVQRGISAPTHPVSGKSGKHYGNAVHNPQDQGVVFKMPVEAYQRDAHDLIGNTGSGQQWVPELIQEAGATIGRFERCMAFGGCAKPATQVWDKFTYCDEHAPNNALPIDGSEPNHAPTTTPPPVTRGEDVRPTVTEAEATDAPRETLIPYVGTTDESSETARPARPEPYQRINAPRAKQGEVMPRPAIDGPAPVGAVPRKAEFTDPHGVLAAPGPESEVEKPAAGAKAVDVIANVVVDRLLPVLTERMTTQIDNVLSGLLKPIGRSPARRPAKAKPARIASEFSQLQTEAKKWGVNSYGKSKEALRADIAAAKEVSDIPF